MRREIRKMNQSSMEKGQQGTLQIKMFGGFAMTWNGTEITFARSGNKKFVQLLQLLFLNYEQGIGKREVLAALYDGGAEAVNNKNLNNVIYRLKRQLVNAGLPDGEDYISLKKGLLRWNSSFTVEIDADRMECFLKGADGEAISYEKQMQLYRQAEAEYTGEFLPESSGELWVVEQNQKYKALYEGLVQKLGNRLMEDGQYEEAWQCYRKAAEIFPADEWQLKAMDCLLELGRFREAQELYRETVRFYCEEMGLPPGKELLKRLRRMEEQMVQPAGDFRAIRAQVKEHEADGAYYCLLPSFIDSCRIMTRMAERSGQSVFLMLLNLNDSSGDAFEDPERLAVQMEKLKDAIRRALRRGDLYTRYSKNQFLIILIGTEQENCHKAFFRLQNEWKQTEGHKGALTYTTESLLQLAGDTLTEQAEQPSWGKAAKKGNLWK